MEELRDQMDGDLQLKGYRPVTRYNYLRCVRSFAAHYRRSPAVLGEAEIRAFLLHLIRKQHAKPATVRMCVAALKFLYATTLRRPEVVAHIPWPQVPQKLPDILTPAEIIQLFMAVRCLKPSAQRAAAPRSNSPPCRTATRTTRLQGGQGTCRARPLYQQRITNHDARARGEKSSDADM